VYLHTRRGAVKQRVGYFLVHTPNGPCIAALPTTGSPPDPSPFPPATLLLQPALLRHLQLPQLPQLHTVLLSRGGLLQPSTSCKRPAHMRPGSGMAVQHTGQTPSSNTQAALLLSPAADRAACCLTQARAVLRLMACCCESIRIVLEGIATSCSCWVSSMPAHCCCSRRCCCCCCCCCCCLCW
jgi:hypothetical protein